MQLISEDRVHERSRRRGLLCASARHLLMKSIFRPCLPHPAAAALNRQPVTNKHPLSMACYEQLSPAGAAAFHAQETTKAAVRWKRPFPRGQPHKRNTVWSALKEACARQPCAEKRAAASVNAP